MDAIQKGWFSEIQEELWPGQAFTLRISKVLHEEKSKYQDIKIFETTDYGTVLVLDGVIQCTTRDEFPYQEMISFLPLCIHPSPKKVLIVGGGDGGVAREVVKHPSVEEVHQVEIDERVVELCKEYLPSMACGFDSPKLKLHIGDGFEYMKNHENVFDVIITDSSDPVGPAESLFQEDYFTLLKRALKADGVVCSQAGTYWTDLGYVKKILDNCKRQFPVGGYAIAAVPSYPCGEIGFILGSLNPKTNLKEPYICFTNKELDDMNMRYYSSEVHRSSFSLPRFAAKVLY